MKKISLMALMSAAIFASGRQVFGGVPLARLSPTVRRKHRKHFTVSHGQNAPKRHAEAKACARRLAFKERHGHFA